MFLMVRARIVPTWGGKLGRPPRRILETEPLHVVALLSQRGGRRTASETGPDHDDGVSPLVGGIHQLHLEAVLVPLLAQRSSRNPRFEVHCHRTNPAKTATGTAVKAPHTSSAITKEIFRCSGSGEGGLTPILLTELQAP